MKLSSLLNQDPIDLKKLMAEAVTDDKADVHFSSNVMGQVGDIFTIDATRNINKLAEALGVPDGWKEPIKIGDLFASFESGDRLVFFTDSHDYIGDEIDESLQEGFFSTVSGAAQVAKDAGKAAVGAVKAGTDAAKASFVTGKLKTEFNNAKKSLLAAKATYEKILSDIKSSSDYQKATNAERAKAMKVHTDQLRRIETSLQYL